MKTKTNDKICKTDDCKTVIEPRRRYCAACASERKKASSKRSQQAYYYRKQGRALPEPKKCKHCEKTVYGASRYCSITCMESWNRANMKYKRSLNTSTKQCNTCEIYFDVNAPGSGRAGDGRCKDCEERGKGLRRF